MGTWFDAKKKGSCHNCHKPTDEGDHIFRKLAGVFLCGQCGTLAEAEPVLRGEVEQSVEDDLALLPVEARGTSLAAAMRVIARKIDADDVSPRDLPNNTKELRMLYLQLKELYPPADDDDPTQVARDKHERRMREQWG